MMLNNYIHLLLILFTFFLSTKSERNPEIHYIISGTLNGTAAFVPFESVDPNQKYLYFTFDFNFHSSAVPKSSDIAFFDFTTDFKLIPKYKEKIKYGFTEKNWNEIKSEEDMTNVKWKPMKSIYKEISDIDRNYYFKINRKGKMKNTLIFRIPINGRKEGFITIENILEPPKIVEKEKNSESKI